MLEVRNLRKEYKSKNGVTTKALDDVSLTFAETGMVFILGKSGSGKSTLLNVCGGLDRYDSGEIIIKGKSSKDFSAADFDSYRNTYVGFVFQEYNILDEFSVEDNIALALELQNKKRDREAIAKILADVDLTDFASRKPNTLSGGQKQRVAIARALVKEPEIIMADEPTGALDSKTGKQVFDTLKKLSKTKLVMVVSHDREFAEQYADRIIELKDGKVLSDMTRDETATAERNVRFYGTDTVCIQNGSTLTEKDIGSILSFLNKQNGAAVITSSREQIGAVKDKIPDIEVGEFKNIEAQPVGKQYPPQKMIRSRFPLRHAIRMGASSIKTKPVRLVFTLLLSIIAFVLFGLASTVMFFNGRSVTEETLTTSNFSYISLGKVYHYTEKYYDSFGKLQSQYSDTRNTYFTVEEYNKYKSEYSGALAAVQMNITIQNANMPQNVSTYYSRNTSNIVLADRTLASKIKAGRLPEAKDEIAITTYMFDGLSNKASSVKKINNGAETDDKLVLNSYTDIVSEYFNLDNGIGIVKVVGVFEGDKDDVAFKALREKAAKNEAPTDASKLYTWQEARRSAVYATFAVTQEFMEEYARNSSGENYFNADNYFNYSSGSPDIYPVGENTESFGCINAMNVLGDGNKKQKIDVYPLNGSTPITSLSAGQIAVPYRAAGRHIGKIVTDLINNDPAFEDYRNEMNAVKQQAHDEFYADYPRPEDYATPEEYDIAIGNFERECREYVKESWASADVYNGIYDKAEIIRMSGDEYKPDVIRQAFKEVMATVGELGIDISSGIPARVSLVGAEETEVKIAGVYYDYDLDWWSFGAYMANDVYDMFYRSNPGSGYNETVTKYKEPKDAFISNIFLPYDRSSALTKKVLDLTEKRNADDSGVQIKNSVMESLRMVIGTVDELGTIFLWIGVVLAAFSFLLMFNFISASITAKRKEIGILRAIGARSIDVFKIFISEALIISLICIAVAMGGTFALCWFINKTLVEDTVLNIALFVFGPFSAAVIVGIGLITALISTVIPVALYSRKPPVSSIRAL